MSSPNIFNKNKPLGLSKRQRAHAMFLAGSDLNEVIAALDLKRGTANSYLFEARCIHENAKIELLK